MTMLQTIASHPSAVAAILAVDDWSNYIYLILIVLSGLGALANKIIERFGGKKGAEDPSPVEPLARKYPPLVTKGDRPRSTPQPLSQPAPPPIVAQTRQAPRPTPQPMARPVARATPSRPPIPARPPQRRTARAPSPIKHKHTVHEDLPSEVAEHVAHRAAVKQVEAATRPKKARSQSIDRAALSETTETPRWVPAEEHMIQGLTSPEELRRAILLREILGPPVALREDDPWSA